MPELVWESTPSGDQGVDRGEQSPSASGFFNIP